LSTAATSSTNEHVDVPPSASVAVIVTVYDPTGRSALAARSALAVPPSAVAGVSAVLVTEPADGAGATPLTARSTTVSSGSVAVTVRVVTVPAGVDSGPPQFSTAGWSDETVWLPSPSNVSTAKPCPCAAGSNASVGSVAAG